jgi:hypothetical protein
VAIVATTKVHCSGQHNHQTPLKDGYVSVQDMMEICNIERPWSESSSYPMTWDEMKAQFSIWSVLTSPLIMGA